MPIPDDFQDNLTDALLLPDVPSKDAASLREVTRSRTVAVIRCRRRMRKCILAVSLAGCYAAGLATVAIQRSAERGTPSLPPISSLLSGPNGPRSQERDSAKLTHAEVVLRDADRCLLDHGDVKEAVRRYDLFLNLASANPRAVVRKQDSWLLMALKDARSKESPHDEDK